MSQELVKNKTANHYRLSLLRITALWAFSEATLGGILHAFKIPFTGFFIGGSAVLFISLIAKYSDDRTAILRSTFIVIIVKAIISPHTPLTAYFAVFIQGLLGSALFYNKKFFKTSALLLGMLALSLSALQKVIILTLLFGNTLWKSIDVFADYVIQQFHTGETSSIQLSWFLIGAYITLHITGGVLFGIAAGRLPGWLESRLDQDYKHDENLSGMFSLNKKPKRSFWRKPTSLLLAFFFLLLILFSLTDKDFGQSQAMDVLIMIIRSVLVMILWFVFVSPVLLKIFHKLVKSRMSKYSDEINEIINIFPQFRHMLGLSWKKSADHKGLKKISHFLTYSFILLLLTQIESE